MVLKWCFYWWCFFSLWNSFKYKKWNHSCIFVFSQVFFTRNGKLIGRKDMVVPRGGLFPTVGMLSRGEKVKVDLHPLSGWAPRAALDLQAAGCTVELLKFSLACCQQQPLLLSSTHACRRHRPPHCMGCPSRNLSILQKSAAAEYRTRTSWEASSGELYAICPASIPSCSLSLYAPWLWSNLSSEIPFMRSGTLTLFHLSQPQAKQSTASPCAESELAGSLCFWESKPPPHPFFPFSMLPLRSAVVLNLIYLSSPWGRAPSPGWAENCSCFTNGKTAIC